MGFDVYIEGGRWRRFKKYRDVKRVREVAERAVGNVKVYVFGSVLAGRYTAASGILIVADLKKKRLTCSRPRSTSR